MIYPAGVVLYIRVNRRYSFDPAITSVEEEKRKVNGQHVMIRRFLPVRSYAN